MDFRAEISRFAATADAYCTWIEGADLSGNGAVIAASKHLSALYSAALCLPDVDADALPHFDAADVDPALLAHVAVKLKTFPMQYYWDVFNPLAKDPEEPSYGDVTDDLLDIYTDLKPGLSTFASHEPLAVWHWRTTFGFHWGRHAVDALKALYAFDPDESPDVGV